MTIRSIYLLIILIFTSSVDLHGQDDIPTTSGFGGYVIFGAGYFRVQSSILVTGAPLVGNTGDKQIESIQIAPNTNGAFALPLAGEINYTFAPKRIQIFFGNRLEDILRLDVPFGFGVRKKLNDSSIVALSALLTPLDLKFWSDPYVEGQDRIKTTLEFPGFRFRWGRMFGTGFEFTFTFRRYIHDYESSGTWLVSQGRLLESERPLLNRDGNVFRFQALYRFDHKQQHRFEPRIRYTIDDHSGAAIANNSVSTQLTYSYLNSNYLLNANLMIGTRKMREEHPVYSQTLSSFRWGIAFTGVYPIELFHSPGWAVTVIAEYLNEDFNANFFDTSVISIVGGLAWRLNRK